MGVRDRYHGLSEDHAATMVQSMWQRNTCVIAYFMKERLGAHGDPGPKSQALDQP